MNIFEVENHPYRQAIEFAVKKYHYNESVLFRGSKNYSASRILYRDPSREGSLRSPTSGMDSSMINTFMSGSPLWEGYPDRRKSMICATDYKLASDYGSIAIVVPIGNPVIGVCPDADFWDCFPIKVTTTTRAITRTYQKTYGKESNFNEWSYEQLMAELNKLPTFSDQVVTFNASIAVGVRELGWVELMEKTYNPLDNGFKTVDWANYNEGGRNEVWFSGPCLIIPYQVFDMLVTDQIKIDQLNLPEES